MFYPEDVSHSLNNPLILTGRLCKLTTPNTSFPPFPPDIPFGLASQSAHTVASLFSLLSYYQQHTRESRFITFRGSSTLGLSCGSSLGYNVDRESEKANPR